MPDISMCKGTNSAEEVCKDRGKCKRFTAKPSPIQSYLWEAPFLGGKRECPFFMKESDLCC